MNRPPPDGTLAVMSWAGLEKGEERDLAQHMLRRVREQVVVPRAHDALGRSSQAPASTGLGSRWLKRIAEWLSVPLADDGLSARFAAERRRDEDLIRRVERRRRL